MTRVKRGVISMKRRRNVLNCFLLGCLALKWSRPDFLPKIFPFLVILILFVNDLFVLNPFIVLFHVFYYCRYTSRAFLGRFGYFVFFADKMKHSVQSLV